MVKHSIQRLEELCGRIPPLLNTIPESDFSFKPSPSKWSKKEILGHLIDSANNNHQRFVRAQFEELPDIFYDSDKWNTHSYYNTLNSEQLVDFWTSYNKHLAALLNHIPESCYQRRCKTGGPSEHTLEFLITDYVEHLEHHLHQIVNYSQDFSFT